MREETILDDSGAMRKEADKSRIRPVLAVLDTRGFLDLEVLERQQNIIGRATEAEIFIPDGRVSRQHAVILYGNFDKPYNTPRCFLQDNHSKNGTFLNGEKITKQVELKPGDRIAVGNNHMIYLHRTQMEIDAEMQLRQLATTDGLTGLLNRATMEMQFEREFERGTRYSRPMALMLIDLDDFKKVNDTFGHEAGDAVLRMVSRAIRTEIRLHDLAARYGGEEFSVLLPETDLKGGIILAHRLCERIARSSLTLDDGRNLNITASIGLAATDQYQPDTLAGLFRMTDQALYQAKAQGKNRPCAYKPAKA